MSVDLVRWLLETHILIALMAGLHLVISGWAHSERWLPAKAQLWLGRFMLVGALLAPGLARLMPEHRDFPAVNDAIAHGRSWLVSPAAGAATGAQLAPVETPDMPVAIPWTMLILGCGAIFLVSRRGYFLARDLVCLRAIVQQAVPLRRLGRLDIRLSDQIVVPMSTRLLSRCYILMPAIMLADRRGFDIALRHEGQHHRHGDTAFAYVIECARLLLAGSPLIGRWTARLTELQELACDAAIVGIRSHNQVSAHAYGSCLVWVTEAAGLVRHAESALAGTASMTTRSSNPRHHTSFLERRIRMLSRYRSEDLADPRRKRRALAAAGLIGAFALGLVQAAAYAAQGKGSQAPLTMQAAQQLSVKASTPAFTVVMNDAILARVNLIITDPGRAKFYRESVARMAEHKEYIAGEIQKYGHPMQLLAVPLIESGYRNLPAKTHKLPRQTIESAGLWQFIRQTALNYGLRVTAKIDDRLDVKLQTDAAMRLLRDDLKTFDHWYLSLAAYNQGEGFVRNAIIKGGTHDAFALIEKGQLGDYLTLLMAAIIILDNPTLVD